MNAIPHKRTTLVLVTGANGFLGSHLVEALLMRGYRVRCMVRRTSNLEFIGSLPVEWAYADLQEVDAVREACQGVDAVCHCAALTRAVDEATFMRVNAGGTETLARICADDNPDLRRFLFVSSQAAAGPSAGPDGLSDENSPPRPITWYGKSKFAAELACLEMVSQMPVTIIRPAAVFGPRDRDFLAYFRLVKRGLSLQLGREERLLNLIDIRDLVDLILIALESETAVGQVYCGCGSVFSYGQFSAAIARALNRRTLSVKLPLAALVPIGAWSILETKLTGRPALLNNQRILDMRQRYWLMSGAKAARELGFTARHSLEDGVREAADWYMAYGWL